jgi:hypothetical protein
MEEPPEPGAVLYRPINAGDPGYTGSCGQLARRRDGGWLCRGLSNCLGMEAMPSLLPADLVHKLDQWACLLGQWDGAAGEDDEEELTRVNSRLAVLVNDEMGTWSRALSEAYEAWDHARGPRKTFETLNTWIEAPAHLAGIAEAYHHGRRLGS